MWFGCVLEPVCSRSPWIRERHARLSVPGWRGNCVSRVFFMLSLLYLKTSNIVLDAFKCRKLSPGGLMAEAYLEVAPPC